ncbi:hypothetical protein KBF38_25630 [bacterium]|jgi:hypothetical protein|nr:hypothetical protein [bacterium]
MFNNKYIVIQLLLVLAITSTPSIAAEASGRDPNKRILTQEEKIVCYAEGYPNTSTLLKTLDNSGTPFCQFIISFAPNGIGHLQSRDKSDHQQKDILKEPGLLIWEQRISFYNENNKLVKLSLNSAEKIFGKSKKIDEANSVFYTFEVGNVPVKNVEQHIYKIDLKFDDKGIIQSYRVSGPRISNPTWISN